MFHQEDRDQLARIERMLCSVMQTLNLEMIEMSELSDAIADLNTKVQADTDVDNSAVTLMNGMSAILKTLQGQVAAAADVPAALAAVKAASATLDQNKTALAASVTANTQPPA